MRKSKPELVSPAGDWSALNSAVENGADSVYFGIKGLNMRNLADNFDISEIRKVMNLLHKHKRKGYLTLNTLIMSPELSKVKKVLRESKAGGVDGVILWDMAVFSWAKELRLPIHLSTQASVANTKALDFFIQQGVKRVILARECSLSDIRQMSQFIKRKKLACEIEVFIHGAMCISVSGRCWLSYYCHHTSANRGRCLQPCRREFLIKDSDADVDYILGEDYLLSSKDLCTIDFIDQLVTSGIDVFKIEGRMRSSEYLKVVTSVYRQAIDAFCEGKLGEALKIELKEKLGTVYNRGFTSGFYFGQPEDGISRKLEHTYEKVFLGEVTKFYKKISVAEVFVRNGPLKKGDELLFIGKSTSARFVTIEELQRNHVFVEKAIKGQSVGIKLPFVVKSKDKVFIWRKKA